MTTVNDNMNEVIRKTAVRDGFGYYLKTDSPLSPNGQYIRLSKGLISGAESIDIIGVNESVGTTSEELWSPGGQLTYLTSAQTMEAISSDVDDTSEGDGARTIQIEGLNGSFEQIDEQISMNGTSATTATTNSFIRVFRAFVVEAGIYGGTNQGTITIRVSGGGSTQTEIPYLDVISFGAGKSLDGHYTIPSGKTGFMDLFTVSAASSKSLNFNFEKRENADNTSTYSPFQTFFHAHDLVGFNTLNPTIPFLFNEKTDIRPVAVVSQNDSEISVSFQIILIDNDKLVT